MAEPQAKALVRKPGLTALGLPIPYSGFDVSLDGIGFVRGVECLHYCLTQAPIERLDPNHGSIGKVLEKSFARLMALDGAAT